MLRSRVAGLFNRYARPALLRARRALSGWGDVRRLRPVSANFGFDRGRPIDRYYIETFLGLHAADVRGRVLEVADRAYTRRFGGDRVTRSDVLHPEPGAPGATLTADLADGQGAPEGAFDCLILTQTLHCIYDIRAAVGTACRALRPGGVVLATLPGISQISRPDAARWGDYWRVTTVAARRLFGEWFPAGAVEVRAYGNVFAAVAFLHGLSCEELRAEELDYHDPDYELLVAVRAVKPGGAS